MSIVLVIIGLIIGGILKGQEVIAGSRQKALIAEIDAVRSAANTYFDRYRSLPGDDPTAGSVLDSNVTNGDGDGRVGTAQTSATLLVNADGSTGENYSFFNGVIAAHLLNGGRVTLGVPTGPAFGTSALPAAPVTGAGVTVVYGTHNGDSSSASTSKTGHWVRLHKNAVVPAPAVSPRTMSNIDTQVDDGLPGSGGVRGDNNRCNTPGAGNPYRVSDDTVCLPLFELSQ